MRWTRLVAVTKAIRRSAAPHRGADQRESSACGAPWSVKMNPVLLKPQSELDRQVVLRGRVPGTWSASLRTAIARRRQRDAARAADREVGKAVARTGLKAKHPRDTHLVKAVRRQVAGGSPTKRLKAREKAASDS
jgi:hypothetical protein